MKQILKHILILAFAAGFIGTACENNDLNIDAGTFPETGGIGLSMGILQSDNYAMENPQINMDHASLSDQFHISLTEPASQTGNYTVKVDESKVLDFNSKHGTNYPLYPTEYVDLGNSGKMTIEKGEQQSNSVSIAFKYDEAIEDSVIYVLPLTVEENNSSPAISSERKTLYYIINVWGMAPAEYNAIKKNFIQIAGVDPEFTNPLLLNKLYFESMSLSSPEVDYYNPFDIINLQFATVKADDNQLPSLYLKDDLAYVLKKREKYIVPLQQLDHKVCLANKDAIADAAAKTDRAFKAGAIAVGAACEITTMPGYLPALSEKADESVLAAAEIAAQTSEKDYQIVQEDTHAYSGGSTDAGDVQHLQPVLTFNTGGKVSGLHSVDFDIVDEELAYVVTAKIFALSAYRLLRDGAVKAKEIVENYQPIFTKEEYIKYMDSFIGTETYQ